MLVFLLMALMIGCFVSLLPHLFPGTIASAFGIALNAWLGNLLGDTMGMGPGLLVTGGPGGYDLTLTGVLVVYGPLLFLVLLGLRR